MTEDVLEVTFKELTTKNEMFCQFDDHHGVLYLDVKNPFTTDDFIKIVSFIEPYYATKGELRGIIINSKKFPYWTDIHNRAEYIHFASDHHKKFRKAAFCMGGFFIKIVARIGRSRVHPELKIFKHNQGEKAQDWILE